MPKTDGSFETPDGIWFNEKLRTPEGKLNVKGEEIAFLRPALRGWVAVNRRYCRVSDFEECIYWCNERSNVGAFASGAWREGMIALEEYPDEGEEKGRPDLYVADLECDHEAIIEAKIHWWDRDPEKELGLLLKQACNQVKARNQVKGRVEKDISVKAGAVFVVPNLVEELRKTFSQQQLLNNLVDNYQPDIMAWYFDKENSHLSYEDKKKNQVYYCPGVALILKISDNSD